MTRPRRSAQTCPSASNSDLKPSAIATRTTAAKTRKLRSRSVVTVVAGLMYRSSEIGGVFIQRGEVYPLPPSGGGLGRGACGHESRSCPGPPVPVLEPHHVVD